MTISCPSVFLVPSSETIRQGMATRFAVADGFTVCPLMAPDSCFPGGRHIVLLVGFELQASRYMDTLMQCMARVRLNGGVVVGAVTGPPSAKDNVRSDLVGLDGVVHYSPDDTVLRNDCARVFERSLRRRTVAAMQISHDALTGGFTSIKAGKHVDVATFKAASASLLDTIRQSGVRYWIENVGRIHDQTYRHCLLMAGVTAGFLSALGVGNTDGRHLVMGALLHDVGKALVPAEILDKQGPLTDLERETMNRHPALGHSLLSRQEDISQLARDVTLYHHEYLDGSGYPFGLRGDQIRDEVRIATICDIYTALIEPRPYKKPLSTEKALSILTDMKERLDPDLLRAFCASVHPDIPQGFGQKQASEKSGKDTVPLYC